MRKLLVVVCVCGGLIANAQYYKKYDWSEDIKPTKLTEAETKASSVGIKDVNIVEYLEGGNSFQLFTTKHQLVHVNDDQGIQRHNRVYIPMYNVVEIVDIKARTINVEGKITELNRDNIKEVKNVDEYGDFKIFAIEGMEVNSDVEVIYTLRKNYYPFGYETIQDDYPIRKAMFVFIHGQSRGSIKAYRAGQKFESKIVDDKQAQVLNVNDVPAMLEEDYSTPRANKLSVAYKCFQKDNFITKEGLWTNVIRNVTSDFFPVKVAKTVEQDIDQFLFDRAEMSEYERAAWLDNFIKTNYTVIQNNNPQLREIDYILKNRSASQSGIIQAYAHYLKALDIEYEVVVTANRFLHKFDPDFFTTRAIQDFLIYLPDLKKYIAPDRIEYRLGEAPFNILGNYGAFVNKTMLYRFDKIEQVEPDFSRIIRETNVEFDEDMQGVTITQNHEYYGHWATNNRANYQLSSDAGREDFKDFLTGSGIEDKVTIEFQLENEEIFQPEYNSPFTVKSQIKSESLIEEAGDNYIFLAGMIIGTQSELYQEEERVNPIEMIYPNRYQYTITVHIPEGYSVKGLESLQIKKVMMEGDNLLCKFESDYSLEGSQLIITINEQYSQNEFPLGRYEEFRTVINAASDFNKASILLRPVE